jgi:ABC-type dipeptide/oligopeptide/nickel transport system permease subunit
MFDKAPWLVYPPGAMIFVTVLSVVLLADGLRDALDPRV